MKHIPVVVQKMVPALVFVTVIDDRRIVRCIVAPVHEHPVKLVCEHFTTRA